MANFRATLRRFAGADAVQLAIDFWRYGLCSALALILDWALLMWLVGAHVNYLAAATTSFLAGMGFAYLGSIVFVYRDRRTYPALAEAIGFVLIGVAGLALNVLLLFAFVKCLGLAVGIAKAPTALGVFLFNFLARRTLLFAGASMTIVPAAASPVAIDLD
jgi:putative flippase GtrA